MTTQGFQFATDATWQFEGVSASSPRNEDCGCGGACGGSRGGKCTGGCSDGCGSKKVGGTATMSLPDYDGQLMASDPSSGSSEARGSAGYPIPGIGHGGNGGGQEPCPPECLQMLPQIRAECCSTDPPFTSDKCHDLSHIYAECIRAFHAEGSECPQVQCDSGCPSECMALFTKIMTAIALSGHYDPRDVADYEDCVRAAGPNGRNCPILPTTSATPFPQSPDDDDTAGDGTGGGYPRLPQNCEVRTMCYPSGTGPIRPFHHCYLEVQYCDGTVSTYEWNFDDGGLRPGFEQLGSRASHVFKDSAPRLGAQPQLYGRKLMECTNGFDPCKCIEDEAKTYPFPYGTDYGIPVFLSFHDNAQVYGPNSNTFVEYVKRQCKMGGGAVPITALGFYFLRGSEPFDGGRAFRIWKTVGRGRRFREVGGRWERRL